MRIFITAVGLGSSPDIVNQLGVQWTAQYLNTDQGSQVFVNKVTTVSAGSSGHEIIDAMIDVSLADPNAGNATKKDVLVEPAMGEG